MEFSNTEKVDLSSIRVRQSHRSPLTTRITALEVGEAFIVEGVERENITSKTTPLRRDGRRFRVLRVGRLRFQIIRID